jgi:hypothetical protein
MESPATAAPGEYDAELIKGQKVIHSSPANAVRAINTAFTAMTTALDLPSIPSWLREGELDIVNKFSIQRRHSPTWMVLPEPPPLKKPSLEYCAVVEALTHYYASKLTKKTDLEWAVLDSDPKDTNAGWPAFSNLPETVLNVLAATQLPWNGSWPTVAEWTKASQELGLQLGVPGDIFSSAIARRAGPTRKEIAIYDTLGSSPTVMWTTKGAYTRTRIVYMVSRLFNIAISPISQQVKSVRTAIPGFGHTREMWRASVDRINSLAGEGMRIVESDFSAYDTSFTPEHRRVIISNLIGKGFSVRAGEMLIAMDDNASVFTPMWSGPSANEADVCRGRFGLLSGMKETSNLGSLHGQALVLKTLVRQGLATISGIKRGDWPFFMNLGDDVLLAVPKTFSDDRYQEDCAEEGIKVKVIPGRRMLMRHIADGRDFAVAARILQQTLANEDSYLHPGHAVLALAARLEGGVYPALAPVVSELLRSQITGELKDFIKVAGLDPTKLLALPVVKDFLITGVGRGWLGRLISSDARPRVTAMLEAALSVLPGADPHAVLVDRAQQLRLLFSHASPARAMLALGATI